MKLSERGPDAYKFSRADRRLIDTLLRRGRGLRSWYRKRKRRSP